MGVARLRFGWERRQGRRGPDRAKERPREQLAAVQVRHESVLWLSLDHEGPPVVIMHQGRVRARKQALCLMPYHRRDAPSHRAALQIAVAKMNAAIPARQAATRPLLPFSSRL